jgi:hypothetical protein
MAEHRTKKRKQTTHYPFLVSWQPKAGFQARVKGERDSAKNKPLGTTRLKERADLLAQEAKSVSIKKSIIRSLILISLVLILELVLYLAWIKLGLP